MKQGNILNYIRQLLIMTIQKESIIYGLRAASILTAIHDTSRNEEEVKKVESLEKEMFPPSLIPRVDHKKFIPYLLGELW